VKNAFGVLLAAGLASVIGANAGSIDLQGMKVIWAVPTNAWPVSGIWSYRAVPRQFSDTVISNAMAIGTFTLEDRKKLSPAALAVDGKAVYFSDEKQTRWLEILPTFGYIKYYDLNAEAKAVNAVKGVPEPVIGVPDLAQATKLALNYAQSLGIDDSQLARKTDGDLDVHWNITRRQWMDPRTNKPVDEIQDFGVYFTRLVGGIKMSGFGDVYVDFGNNAKVHELEINWRNLQPYQLLTNLVTPAQIISSIQNGETALPTMEGWPIDSIKTLTITNAVPRYGRKPGDEPVEFLVPALQLDAIADNGNTNKPIWFQTGIFPPKTL
jgi:hypothetical protein